MLGAEFVRGRVCQGPSLLVAEVSRNHLKLQAPVTFASTNSGYNNFGFIISAPKLNFCIRKLRRIVTNFIYLRSRVCISDCTVIHVCRGRVQLKKSILTKEDKSSNLRQYL